MTLNLVKDKFGYPLSGSVAAAAVNKSPRQDAGVDLKASPILKGGVQNKREIFMRQISSPEGPAKPFLMVSGGSGGETAAATESSAESAEEPPPPPPRAHIPKPGLFPSNSLGRMAAGPSGSGGGGPPLVKSSSQDDIMSTAPVHRPTAAAGAQPSAGSGGVRAMASKLNNKISSSIEALEAAHRSPISPSKMSLTSSSDSLSSTASNITVKSVSPAEESSPPPSLPPRPSPTKGKAGAPPLASPEASEIPNNLVSNSPFKTGHLSPVKTANLPSKAGPASSPTKLQAVAAQGGQHKQSSPKTNPATTLQSSSAAKAGGVSPAKTSLQTSPPLVNGSANSPPSPKTAGVLAAAPPSPKPALPLRTSKPPSPSKPVHATASRTLPHVPTGGGKTGSNTSTLVRPRPAAPTPPASPRPPRVSHPPPPPPPSTARTSSSPQLQRRSTSSDMSSVGSSRLSGSVDNAKVTVERLSGGRKLPVPPPTNNGGSSPKNTLPPPPPSALHNGHHHSAASPKLGGRSRNDANAASVSGGSSPKPILKNGRQQPLLGNGHLITNGHHSPNHHHHHHLYNGLNGDVYTNNDFDPSDLSLEGTSVDDDGVSATSDLQRSLVFKKAEEVVVRVVDQLKESLETCRGRYNF